MNIGGFNNKLQSTTFSVKKGTTQIINKSYDFYDDGAVKKETDNLDARFDRSYKYDFLSRLSEERSGAEARGQTDSPYNIPYRSDVQFDTFGHRTQNVTKHYAQPVVTTTTNYQNNRMVGGTYDFEGNLKSDMTLPKSYDYDAAGRLQHSDYEYAGSESYTRQQEFYTFSGDGFLDKIVTSNQENEDPAYFSTTYRIRSTVLNGQVIYEDGRVFVHANGTKIATHFNYGLVWSHKDPNLKSFRSTGQNGGVIGNGDSGNETDKVETDSDGRSVGFTDPGLGFPSEGNYLFQAQNPFGSMIGGQFTTYAIDGIMVPQDHFASAIEMAFGGMFGIIERQARISTQKRVIGRWVRTVEWNTFEMVGEEIVVGTHSYSYVTSIVYDTNWSINWSIFAFQIKLEDVQIPLPDDLKDRLIKRAGDDTDCGKAIQRLLDKLDPKKKNRFKQSKKDRKNKVSYIESLYNRVEGAIELTADLPPFHGDIGSKSFVVKGAKITIGQATEEFAEKNNYTIEQVNEAYTTVMIHELIHNAKKKGRYTDQQVLNAVIALMKEDGKEPPEPTDVPASASQRINTSFMRTYCPAAK